MANGGTVTIKAILDIDQFKAGIAQVKSDLQGVDAQGLKGADDAMKGLGTSADGAGKSTKTFTERITGAGKTVSSIGGALTKTLTPAMVGIGAASVAAAVKIDTSLTNVRKTVDGTEAQYQQLKNAAIEFSKTNAVSADQILDIQALGAQLGFSVDELQEFGEVVSGLDIATNMDAETAATEMAQFANITKMSHGEVRNYGSAIVELGNNFATTESDISHMAMRIAAAGTQVGMSQADILGLATALSSLGVEAEAGGTAISTIMSEVDKAVATNSESLQVWASTAGMSAEAFADAWRKNPVDALTALLTNMENTTAEGGNMSLMLEELGIDSVRQSDIMKRLAGNSQLVGDAVRTANTAWRENTALQAEVDNRNNSLAAKFEMLKNRVMAIAEKIGGPLANALLDAVDAAEPLFQAIAEGAEAFSRMDEGQQRLIITVGALAAAIGPLLSVVGKGMESFDTFKKGLDGLSSVFDSFHGKVTGVGSSLADIGEDAAGATEGLSKMSGSMGLSASAAAGLSGALAAIGIAAIVALSFQAADAFQQAAKESEDFAKATDGLREASQEIPGIIEDTSSGVEYMAQKYIEGAKSVDELRESQAELVDSITQTNKEASSGITELDRYRATIEELAGQSDLSERDVARLKLAVDGLNEATGSSYEVVQNTAGAYVLMSDGAEVAKESVLQLIEAQKLQIQLEASKTNYEETLRKQAEAADTLTNATIRYNEEQKKYAELSQECIENGWGETEALKQQQAARDDANKEMQEANKLYQEATGALETMEDRTLLLTAAQQEGASAQLMFVANNQLLQSAVLKSGESLMTFAEQLTQAGISTEELSSLSNEQLIALGEAYDGTFTSINGLLEQYGIHLNEGAEALLASEEPLVAMMETMQQFGEAIPAEKLAEYAQKLLDIGVSQEELASLTPEQLQILVSSWDEAVSSIDGSAQSIMEALRQMGAAEEDLANLTPEQLQTIVDSWDGSVESIIAAAEKAGVEIPPHFKEAMDKANQHIDDGGREAEQKADQAEQGVADELAQIEDDAPNSAREGMDGYTSEIDGAAGEAGSAGSNVNSSAMDELDNIEEEAPEAAREGMDGYRGGIEEAEGGVRSAAGAVGDATEEVKKHNGEARGWGLDLGSMFADGINAAIGWVSSAASAIANAARSILHFSKPDKGPLKEGTEVYGEHLVENFAKGMGKREDVVVKMTSGIAGNIKDQFTGLYDDLIELPNIQEQNMPHATPGINWYATEGNYDKLSALYQQPAEPYYGGEAPMRLMNVTPQVNIEHFENYTDQDVNKLTEYVSRRIADQTRAKMKGRGVVA